MPKEFNPDYYVFPVKSVIEILRFNKMEISDLPKLIDESEDWCSDFLIGKSELTEEIAEKLHQKVGGTKQFWINLEKNYRETKARLENADSPEQRWKWFNP